MEENNSPIFSQAKLEYTIQLVNILTPHMFDGSILTIGEER